MKKQNKQVIITTSWDDGNKSDLKLAKLLKKYKIKGTFYVLPNNKKLDRKEFLSDKEIVDLSRDFEIGAHTMTHPRLTKISLEEAKKEIVDSKKYLEKLTGKEINSFCYPGGDYNKDIRDLVEESGFICARTINPIRTKYPKDPFEIGVTIKSCSPSVVSLFGEAKYVITKNIHLIQCLFTKDWEKRSKIAFDFVLKNGGIFHLWGHSWELDNFNEWDKFERILRYISKRPNVIYLVNSELNRRYK